MITLTIEAKRQERDLNVTDDAYTTVFQVTIVMSTATQTPIAPGGVKSYYQAKIESAEILINQKTQNLRRLEAQRNALNARGEQ